MTCGHRLYEQSCMCPCVREPGHAGDHQCAHGMKWDVAGELALVIPTSKTANAGETHE